MSKAKTAAGAFTPNAQRADAAPSNETMTQVEHLRRLLAKAGSFQRPVGVKGSRMLRADTTYGVEFADGVPEGSVEREVKGPDGQREELTGKGPWQPLEGWSLVSERRSAIDERVDAVRELRAELETIIVPMLRVGTLHSEAWNQVLADDLLDADTVREALATIEPGDGGNREGLRVKTWTFLKVLRDACDRHLTLHEIVLRAFPNQGHKVNTDDKRAMGELVQGKHVQTEGGGRGSTRRYWFEASS